MKQQYQLLYHDMLEDIKRCMQLELPESERYENAFWIAHNYFDRLKELMDKVGFKNIHEEIDFFRNTKPKFTCYIEYFLMLSEVILFVPNDTECAISYWKKERERFDRFKTKFQSFIVDYYEQGKISNDKDYFTREQNNLRYILNSTVWDVDPDYCSSHDQLVRSYLANQMFHQYIDNKIEGLMKNNPANA